MRETNPLTRGGILKCATRVTGEWTNRGNRHRTRENLTRKRKSEVRDERPRTRTSLAWGKDPSIIGRESAVEESACLVGDAPGMSHAGQVSAVLQFDGTAIGN